MSGTIFTSSGLDDHLTWEIPENSPPPRATKLKRGKKAKKRFSESDDEEEIKVRKPTSFGAGVMKGNWSSEEDALLTKLVEDEMNGRGRDLFTHTGRPSIRWSEISKYLPNRVGKQCRERYENHLKPDLNKGRWTASEELVVYSCVQRWGHQWASISRLLKSRSDNRIKNHWNCHILRRMRMDPAYRAFMDQAYRNLDISPLQQMEADEGIVCLPEPIPELVRLRTTAATYDPDELFEDVKFDAETETAIKAFHPRQRRNSSIDKKSVSPKKTKPDAAKRPKTSYTRRPKIELSPPPVKKRIVAAPSYSYSDLYSPKKSYRRTAKPDPVPVIVTEKPKRVRKAPMPKKPKLDKKPEQDPVVIPIKTESVPEPEEPRLPSPEIPSREGKELVFSTEEIANKPRTNLLVEAKSNLDALLLLTALTAPTSSTPFQKPVVQKPTAQNPLPPKPNPVPQKTAVADPVVRTAVLKHDAVIVKSLSEETKIRGKPRKQPVASVRRGVTSSGKRVSFAMEIPRLRSVSPEPERVPAFSCKTRSKTSCTSRPSRPLFVTLAPRLLKVETLTVSPRQFRERNSKTPAKPTKRLSPNSMPPPVIPSSASITRSMRVTKPKHDPFFYESKEMDLMLTPRRSRKQPARFIFGETGKTLEEIEKSLPPPLPLPELAELLCSEDEVDSDLD